VPSVAARVKQPYIAKTLGDMAQLFDNDIREIPNIYDFKG